MAAANLSSWSSFLDRVFDFVLWCRYQVVRKKKLLWKSFRVVLVLHGRFSVRENMSSLLSFFKHRHIKAWMGAYSFKLFSHFEVWDVFIMFNRTWFLQGIGLGLLLLLHCAKLCRNCQIWVCYPSLVSYASSLFYFRLRIWMTIYVQQ